MLKPDQYFKNNEHHFPAKNRHKARLLFRRAIRQYHVMRRKYVVDPATGRRVQTFLIGEFVKNEKTQRRKVKRYFSGQVNAGRPSRPEIKLLVARIIILWGKYANTSATFAWKSPIHNLVQTEFELFVIDLFPRLGASDVRRYIETHWKERK
jgi:hypothetical protein